jgi:hypothetical protein
MQLRCRRGATLGLVVAFTFLLAVLGSAFYFLLQFISGHTQVSNAADAAVLSAARQIEAISISQASVRPEFRQLGVDINTGQPDAVLGVMNIFAYNRAAGTATLIAINALEEGNQNGAINNANIVIGGLQAFGDNLNAAIVASGKLGNPGAVACEAMANQNNVSMMGSGSVTNLTSDLQFASVTTGVNASGGKSNVYFNPIIFGNDGKLANFAAMTEDASGAIRSVALPTDQNAPSYTWAQAYASGQPMVKAYEGIALGGGLTPIYFCATNPAGQPHLIDVSRYSASPARIDHAPVNSVMTLTQTKGTNQPMVPASSVVCALVGALYNEYPISMPNGYIRIRNGPDARVANPNFPAVYGSVNGSQNIFNNQIWSGSGGGISYTNNGVFGTVNSGAASILQAFATYNNSASTATNPDDHGLQASLDPSDGYYQSATTQQKYASVYAGSVFNPSNGGYKYISGDLNFRITANYNQAAQISDMLQIASVAEPGPCGTTSYDTPIDAGCSNMLATFIGNYGSSNSLYSLPSNATLTNLEALKGEVITNWVSATTADVGSQINYAFTTTGSEFNNDSGSKVYWRNGKGYACPSNTQGSSYPGTIAFGNVGSPGELLAQLTSETAVAVDLANPEFWGDTSTIQGALLQRCQEIQPGVSWETVTELLYQSQLDINQCQYIYQQPGGGLVISTSPPPILAGLAEVNQPGVTKPDGAVFSPSGAQDSNFYDSIGNQIDAEIFIDRNTQGDNELHQQPFENYTGMIDTYDYATWQPSCGANCLLGELVFYNHVIANVTFSAP